MSRRLVAAFAALFLSLVPAARAFAAEAAPAWSIVPLATPTNFVPGDTEHTYSYQVRIANVGAAPADGTPITIRDELPPGLEVEGIEMPLSSTGGFNQSRDYGDPSEGFCETGSAGARETVTCTISESMPEAASPALVEAGEERRVVIRVFVPETVTSGTVLENNVSAEGGGAPLEALSSKNLASEAEAPAGVSFSQVDAVGADGLPLSVAGSHPFQLVSTFAVNTNPPAPTSSSSAKFVPAGGDLKDVQIALPPGLIGGPTAATRCTAQQFNSSHSTPVGSGGTFITQNDCPDGSAVGIALVQQIEGESGDRLAEPVYNLVPPPGVPAQLGIQILNLPFYIDAEVQSTEGEGGLRVVGTLRNTSQAKRLTAATLILWGTPGDSVHDPIRGSCVDTLESTPISLGSCESGLTSPRPFLRMPTSCSASGQFLTSFDNWTSPGEFFSAPGELLATEGCAGVPFDPSLPSFRPTSDVADSPAGLSVDVHIPQREHEGSGEQGEADLRDVTVSLPPGLVINPSGANGLSSCSAAQIGLGSTLSPTCPAASRIGSVQVDTPLLDHSLPGSVYVATPYENPFSSLLAIYIVVDDPISGVVAKIPAGVTPDPATGQLTATVSEAPQVPFEDFRLEFFGGSTAVLRTPATCGTYATQATLTPWSAPYAPAKTVADSYAIVRAPTGGPCPASPVDQPNAPSFEAGTRSPRAGAYTPLVLHLAREDGSQEFSSITVTPPPGLLGKLAGIPYCDDAALAAAAAKSGRAEEASPSCPAASAVGNVYVGAGAGPDPYFVHGTAYLAGPYKGAPLSLAIVTPATAGPYDLGTVVVRSALFVDPYTTQITVVSDPIPTRLKGIPLDVRSIDVRMDRPEFTLNPTSCGEMGVAGEERSVLAQPAALASRFQVGECGRLAVKPHLSIRLKGRTKRSGHPALTAVLKMPAGGANLARVQVGLPHSAFLDNGHLDKVCNQHDLAAATCPKRSVYGWAKAWSPLLDKPLTGKVYLGVGFGHTLPDLVVELNGQIRVLLHARVDTDKADGIRNTFEIVPDAPVSRFVLHLKGGSKYGLIENSENLCRHPQRAGARFRAQNGHVVVLQPKIANGCKTKRHRRHRHHRRSR